MYHRAVLVPVWRHVNLNVVVLQTRGDDFVKQCTLDNLQYEVDTVERDGSVSTQEVQLAGVASLGVAAQKAAFFGRIPELTHLRYVGVGVTEAGIHPSSQAMKDLAAFLVALVEYFPGRTILLVPPALQPLVASHVTFHNSMVDRITASRPSNSMVPYTEPLPPKALVIEDLTGQLPLAWGSIPGVQLRTQPTMVYALALSRLPTTAAAPPVVFTYLDGLVQKDLAPGLLTHGLSYGVIQEVYKDWIHRLKHKYFGMDTFFVAQNAWTKYTIRLLATIAPHVQDNDPRVLNRKAKTAATQSTSSGNIRQGNVRQTTAASAAPQPGANANADPLSQLATAIGLEGSVVIPAFPALNLPSVVVEKIYFAVLAVLAYLFGARALVLGAGYYIYLTQRDTPPPQ
ncbi:hypothetical protein B5M09_009463 [Aphanomyces astaci]|uniref:Uncharacterized protein n=1 Tax=Aphanomyces astaci TaxID=112090 RepID=A0A3R7WGS4_APHAT|nr:hypothetical protein B5M09_009463 [Aphanomyces astaci]